MNYYRHHLGDYAKDTAGLSLLEHGAYRLLLDSIYASEKPIPNLMAAQRICGAQTKRERDAVSAVVSMFFFETDKGYWNKRAESEIQKYKQLAESGRESGRIGAARRWHGVPHQKNIGYPIGNPMPNPISNPIETAWGLDDKSNNPVTSNHKPEENTPPQPPKGGERKRFVPPTVAEVKAYCDERRNSVDPQVFVDHYTSKGWVVGKTAMKDWRAAVRTWERNNVGTGSTNTGGNAGSNFGKVDGPRVRSEGPTGLLAQLDDELRRGAGDANGAGG